MSESASKLSIFLIANLLLPEFLAIKNTPQPKTPQNKNKKKKKKKKKKKRSGTAPITRGQEIYVLAAPLRQEKGWTVGTVSRVLGAPGHRDRPRHARHRRARAARCSPPRATSRASRLCPTGAMSPRRGATRIVRIERACDVIAAAAKKVTGAAKEAPAPSAAHLPVEPVSGLRRRVQGRRRPSRRQPEAHQMDSADFEVGFITPLLNYAAQSQSDPNLGNWSEYAADIPPVLFVRVTPKMVESLWAKVARGAAQTQGTALPALQQSLEVRLPTAVCLLRPHRGQRIHRFSSNCACPRRTRSAMKACTCSIPAALGPECGTVTLVLHSEKEPEKADTRAVHPKLLQQIRRYVGRVD